MGLQQVVSAVEKRLYDSVSVPVEDFAFEDPKDHDLLRGFARDGYVDLGDVFVCLEGDGKCGVELPGGCDMSPFLRMMGYAEKESLTVRRSFATVSLSEGVQIATIKFSPIGETRSRPPIILGTGLWHGTGVMDDFAAKLAEKLNCDVILYDLPSMGASQLQPHEQITQKMFEETLLEVVKYHLEPGDDFIPISFSLSTFGQRAHVHQACNSEGCDVSMPAFEELGYNPHKIIFMNPTRTVGESHDGSPYARSFVRGLGLQLITRWGDTRVVGLEDFFDPEANPEAARLVQRAIGRMSLFDFLGVLFTNDTNRIVGVSLGRSEKVRFILSEDDTLMPNDYLDGPGIIRVPGRHADVVDPRYHDVMIEAIREAIDEPLDFSRDAADLNDVFSGAGVRFDSLIGYRGDRGILGLSSSLDFTTPFIELLLGVTAGMEFTDDMVGFGAYFTAETRLSLPDIYWLRVYGNLTKGLTVTRKSEWHPMTVEAGLHFEPWGLLFLRAGAIWSLQGDLKPGAVVTLGMEL